ncbi:MAG: hypothetical protein ACFE95_10280, partial [Candidatus Hodarchaeota archaeon]
SLKIDGLITPKEPKWGTGVWWKYTLLFDPAKFKVSRNQILEALRAEGILSAAPVVPDNLQPLFSSKKIYGNTNCPWDCKYYKSSEVMDYSTMCPSAKAYAERAIWLTGCSPNLTDDDLNSLISAVEKVTKWYHI